MKTQLTFILVAAFLTGHSWQQSIVDFTYSQYVHNGKNNKEANQQIIIRPNRQILEGYNFPEVCNSIQQLKNENTADSNELQSLDLDTLVDGLKVQLVELLRLSEKITQKKAHIQGLNEISYSSNITIVTESDFELLRKLEDRLKSIDAEVNEKTKKLDQLVLDSMRNSGSGQFVISALNFEIESLKIKLAYLKGLQRQSKDKQGEDNDDEFDTYFETLKKKFDEENELVNDLNGILQNYNEIGILKNKNSLLRSEINILEMMADEKRTCLEERESIKKFHGGEGEVAEVMRRFREKKRDREHKDNKYCEGVSVKLEDEVKKILIAYDYTFECAEGLEEIEEKIRKMKEDLAESERRVNLLEDHAGIDEYKKKFQENRDFIKLKHDEISHFQIDPYQHDRQELTKLIEKTEDDLENAESKRKSLSIPPSQRTEVDYRMIQSLVEGIKKLKGNYCLEYENYEKKAQQHWARVNRFQNEVEYRSKMEGVYKGEVDELKEMESRFKRLRQSVINRLA